MAKCCMCERKIEREDAPVLTMSIGGSPRLLCDDCAALMDTVTLGRDYDQIKAAMEKVGRLMADGNADTATYSVISQVMLSASERAKAIKSGEYDFALDEAPAEEGFEEIPEELQETEEDKELDRIDEEKNKLFDKIYNVVLIVALVAVGAFVVWKIVERFI